MEAGADLTEGGRRQPCRGTGAVGIAVGLAVIIVSYK